MYVEFVFFKHSSLHARVLGCKDEKLFENAIRLVQSAERKRNFEVCISKPNSHLIFAHEFNTMFYLYNVAL